jgi:large subunit ribosomal protein L28
MLSSLQGLKKAAFLSVLRPLQLRPSMTSLPTVQLFMAHVNNSLDFLQTRYRSNRSRRGLYDGKDIRSGNNVSFSMRATKRTFKPNVFIKRIYSETLDDMIRFHLTTSTLRSIDKAGGLDNYLLSNNKITEGEGFAIRNKILKRLKNDAKNKSRAVESVNQVGTDSSLRI